MAIEIVVFPIKYGDFPVRYVSLPEGTWTSELKISVFFQTLDHVYLGFWNLIHLTGRDLSVVISHL